MPTAGHPAVTRASRLPGAEVRLLPVTPMLAGLLPDGGLRRGTTTLVAGTGATSVGLALAAEAPWTSVVGVPSFGVVAAAELGVRLDRLVLVPNPGDAWTSVVAACVEAFDVVIAGPPASSPRTADVRRVEARIREGRCAVLALRRWPGTADMRVLSTAVSWTGLRDGHGHLRARRIDVTVDGRRVPHPRRASLWLPTAAGGIGGEAAAAPAGGVGTAEVPAAASRPPRWVQAG